MYNIEVQIKISQSDVSIEVVYFLEILDLDDIRAGYWCMSNTNISKVFSSFVVEEDWHLLEEGMGYWVNDNFDEEFPFSFIYSEVNEYKSDLIWIDPTKKTDLMIIINNIP